MKINVSLDNCLKIIDRSSCPDCDNLKVASDPRVNVKLHDATLLIEVAQVLVIIAADVFNHRLLNRQLGPLEHYLLYGFLDIRLILSEHGNLPLVASNRRLLHLNLDVELILDPLNLRALRPDDESDQTLIHHDLFYNRIAAYLSRLLASTHVHHLLLRVEQDVCLDGGTL